MSPERTRKFHRRFLPLSLAAALAGTGVACTASPTVREAVQSIWSADSAACGSAVAQPGDTPTDVVRAAAFDALHMQPGNGHFENEVAAGQDVGQQWQGTHPHESFQVGTTVEAHVAGTRIVDTRLLGLGEAACGRPAPTAR